MKKIMVFRGIFCFFGISLLLAAGFVWWRMMNIGIVFGEFGCAAANGRYYVQVNGDICQLEADGSMKSVTNEAYRDKMTGDFYIVGPGRRNRKPRKIPSPYDAYEKMACAGETLFLMKERELQRLNLSKGEFSDLTDEGVRYLSLAANGKFFFVFFERLDTKQSGILRYSMAEQGSPEEFFVWEGEEVQEDEYGYRYLWDTGERAAICDSNGRMVMCHGILDWGEKGMIRCRKEKGGFVLETVDQQGEIKDVTELSDKVNLALTENCARDGLLLITDQNDQGCDCIRGRNRETGEVEILYETRSKRERIVAIGGGSLILLRVWDRTLWKVNPNSGEREKIAQLAAAPRGDRELNFEHCGDRLFVWSNRIRRGWEYLDSIWIGEAEVPSE